MFIANFCLSPSYKFYLPPSLLVPIKSIIICKKVCIYSKFQISQVLAQQRLKIPQSKQKNITLDHKLISK